jgi:hypothetical protein
LGGTHPQGVDARIDRPVAFIDYSFVRGLERGQVPVLRRVLNGIHKVRALTTLQTPPKEKPTSRSLRRTPAFR